MTPGELKKIYANCNSWWEVSEAVNTQLAAAQAELKEANLDCKCANDHLAAAQAAMRDHDIECKNEQYTCPKIKGGTDALDAAIAAAILTSAICMNCGEIQHDQLDAICLTCQRAELKNLKDLRIRQWAQSRAKAARLHK